MIRWILILLKLLGIRVERDQEPESERDQQNREARDARAAESPKARRDRIARARKKEQETLRDQNGPRIPDPGETVAWKEGTVPDPSQSEIDQLRLEDKLHPEMWQVDRWEQMSHDAQERLAHPEEWERLQRAQVRAYGNVKAKALREMGANPGLQDRLRGLEENPHESETDRKRRKEKS